MTKRGVWTRIKRNEETPNRRTIGSKRVLKRKRDGCFRARLYRPGYTQIAGVGFNTNYAPVINDATLRISSVLNMSMKWEN